MRNHQHLTTGDVEGIASRIVGQPVTAYITRGDEALVRPPVFFQLKTSCWTYDPEDDVHVRGVVGVCVPVPARANGVKAGAQMLADHIRGEAMKRQFTTCKSCRARIWWAVSIHGKAMPMDPDAEPNAAWVIEGQTENGAPKIRHVEPLTDGDAHRRSR